MGILAQDWGKVLGYQVLLFEATRPGSRTLGSNVPQVLGCVVNLWGPVGTGTAGHDEQG
jgi:hypothetical protein